MASEWNWIRAGMRRAGVVACLVALNWAVACHAQTLTVPFTETFAPGDANWKIGATVAEVPTWQSSGGPANSAYISRQFTVPTTGSGFSGPLLFRGQDSFDSSNDRFVGDWITGGVGQFSVNLRHNAAAAVLFEVRLANAANSPGASTVSTSVPANTWTTLTVPIVDSAAVFQTYGQLGNPPNASAFAAIFSSIGNIQIGLAPVGIQDASVRAGTWTFDVAAPSIAAVPEPGTWASLAGAAAGIAAIRWHRLRGRRAA
jgi:hypothetical protein